MSDAYSVGARPVTREPYRGRYRTNRTTGERQVWNGTRYVPETAQSLAPEAQEQIQQLQRELNTDNQAVRYADEFLELNSREPTGALWHGHMPFQDPDRPVTFNDPEVQAMVNIQNRFVRGNIQPGTSGAGNTGPEQIRIERSGPALANTGPANRTIALNLQIDRDLRARQLTEMQRWARNPRTRSLEGFDQWWAANQRRIRTEIQRRYEETNGPVNRQANRWGAQIDNPPRRPANVPNNYVWDSEREVWTPNAR